MNGFTLSRSENGRIKVAVNYENDYDLQKNLN